MKIAGVTLFIAGLITGLYGSVRDYEPLTLIGAFLMVAGLIRLVFRNTQKTKIVQQSTIKK